MRDVARASSVLATAERVGVAVAVGRLDPEAAALDADLVVSTLPAGAADPLAAHPWRAEQAVLDVAYDPWPSAVAASVAAAGGTVVSGALMLLHQAADQVRLMTGRTRRSRPCARPCGWSPRTPACSALAATSPRRGSDPVAEVQPRLGGRGRFA